MKKDSDKKKKLSVEKNQLSKNQNAKKDNLVSVENNTAPASGKKIPKWYYAVLFLLPIVFLVLLEIFLRIINYGYDFEQWVDAGEAKYVINPNLGKKYFSNIAFTPRTTEDVFDQNKKVNSFRVFVLGESSAEGYPYIPVGSFSSYIRQRLKLAYPNTVVEVVNIAMTAINSYTVRDLIPGVLDQKPDLILIYTGHNEYYGALGVGSVESYGSSRTLIKLILYLDNFKVTQFVRNSIHWVLSLFSSGKTESSGTLMSNMAKDKYIPLNSKVFDEGLQQFEANMTDILQMIKDKGIPVILGRLVSNLKDQKPFISVNTPGYKNADQVFEEACAELKNNNFTKAKSLFKLAKELDALRFRAPEKINTIIDNLGKEFHAATVPIDSIFDAASPDGIVGDNLIVDHLHPNVRGYQLIGKAFYESMERLSYLPKTETVKVPFSQQDSLTRSNFMFTRLDSLMGNDDIIILKNDWPYVKGKGIVSKLQPNDFLNLFKPADFIDSIAMLKATGSVSWSDAHLLAATDYLRKDDIEHYLLHMYIIIYQYPILRDLNSALKYFYEQNKISPADYTLKRVGIMNLYRGNLAEAVSSLDQAAKSSPNDPSILYYLSLAYLESNDPKTALAVINKCLSVTPNFSEANKLKQQILNQLTADKK